MDVFWNKKRHTQRYDSDKGKLYEVISHNMINFGVIGYFIDIIGYFNRT